MTISYEQLPVAVQKELLDSLPLVRKKLPEEKLIQWADEGIALAAVSLRSWESSAEYFKVSPKVVDAVDFDCFTEWIKNGKLLAEKSAALACSYFQASPATLSLVTKEGINTWVCLGLDLYDGNWKSGMVAGKFFEFSPRLLRVLNLEELKELVSLTVQVSHKSSDLAIEFLDLACEAFSLVEAPHRQMFLSVAGILTRNNCFEIKTYLKIMPGALLKVSRIERLKFLQLLEKIGARSHHHIPPLMTEGAGALCQVETGIQGKLLEMSDKLLFYSPVACIQFLKSSAAVLNRGVSVEGLENWYEQGLRTLKDNLDGGEAYFSLESSRGQKLLNSLTCRIDLGQVEEVLRLYCCALTGRKIRISSLENLAQKRTNWLSVERPVTDGQTIYLPHYLECYRKRQQNFTWLKVAATHQAGHIEFGSFGFSWDRDGNIFPSRRKSMVDADSAGKIADFETFFSCFSDVSLARDIFTIVEDCRVDYRVKKQYGGLRNSYEWAQKDAIARRRQIFSLPLREAFVELLVRLSLGDDDRLHLPVQILSPVQYASQVINRMKSVKATVEDSVEATIYLYEVAHSIPNIFITPPEWVDLSPEEMESLNLEASYGGKVPSAGELNKNLADKEYNPAEEVDFRGDFDPEIVQLMVKARQVLPQDMDIMSIPPDKLKELIGQQIELQMSSGETSSTSGTFISDIQSPVPQPEARQKEKVSSLKGGSGKISAESNKAEDEPLTFLYDEWDFRAGDYRPGWCCIREHSLAEGSADFYNSTISDNRSLATQIKKQFEQLCPELFKKIRRLENGEEFELDATIEAVVERKRGGVPGEKIYWRRNKVERDVATVFLLDMSASTAEVISGKLPSDEEFTGDPREYFNWLRSHPVSAKPDRNFKRIIDIEKDSIVLLINALEALGDRYGIYAFSGYGRQNVEFLVIKDIERDFGEDIKKRIDKISPLHATRMGAAIRHATSKLEESESKTRILFLISDGRPQDQGYGRDGMEKEYAIQDTRKSLLEAKHKGIIPFCLTIDKSGQDYLRTMCRDMDYEVVANIKSLPKRLPALYRRLTS